MKILFFCRQMRPFLPGNPLPQGRQLRVEEMDKRGDLPVIYRVFIAIDQGVIAVLRGHGDGHINPVIQGMTGIAFDPVEIFQIDGSGQLLPVFAFHFFADAFFLTAMSPGIHQRIG